MLGWTITCKKEENSKEEKVQMDKNPHYTIERLVQRTKNCSMLGCKVASIYVTASPVRLPTNIRNHECRIIKS